MNGFEVDLPALQALEDNIRGAAKQLSEMNGWGFGALGNQGIGLSAEASDAAADAGNPDLEDAIVEFGDRWEIGVSTLVQDGLDAADVIAEVRQEYQSLDADTAAEILRIVGG